MDMSLTYPLNTDHLCSIYFLHRGQRLNNLLFSSPHKLQIPAGIFPRQQCQLKSKYVATQKLNSVFLISKNTVHYSINIPFILQASERWLAKAQDFLNSWRVWKECACQKLLASTIPTTAGNGISKRAFFASFPRHSTTTLTFFIYAGEGWHYWIHSLS